jgi:hypothetical protein
MRSPQNPRSKPRLGCLGSLVAFSVLGVVFLLALTAVFAPWGFYLGGKFHLIPYWQGWGKLHAKNGTYIVLVRFEPTSGGRLNTYVKGVAYLCTPRGERFQLRLGGSMRRHLNLSTDGEAMRLWMYRRPYWGFNAERRPGIELRGKWQNPNLVMDDGGSISRAFQPDGRPYFGHDPNRPYASEIVPVTLTEGSTSEFNAACADPH